MRVSARPGGSLEPAGAQTALDDPVINTGLEAGEEYRDDVKDAELILTAFRTLVLIVVFAGPLVLGLNVEYDQREIILAALAGIYNIAMGVACLFPGRYGVRRPLVLAMDTMLVTVWMHFTMRWELMSFYYIIVVVASMWYRVAGGVLAAAVCDFLFLFLWGRMAADPATPPPPFTFNMAINSALLFMVGALAGYIGEAQEKEREQRLERELLIANYQQEIEVSTQLQPLLISRLDGRHVDLDLGVAVQTARSAGGGDYIDALPLPDGRTLLCIADVAGKSVRAQARVPLLKYSLRALAPLHSDPEELAARLQATLEPDLQPEIYIALCLITLDAEEGSITWCNAGHMPPLMIRGGVGEPVVKALDATMPAMGLFPDMPPVAQSMEWKPSDVLLLFTDGLTDALSFGGTVDGEAQVRRLAARLVHEDAPAASVAAQELTDLATSALEEKPFLARHVSFGVSLGERMTGGTPRRDDIAVMVVRRPPALKKKA